MERELREHGLRTWESMRAEPGFVHADPAIVATETVEYELASLALGVGLDRPVRLSNDQVWYPPGMAPETNCDDIYANVETEADLLDEDARFERCIVSANRYEPENPVHITYMAHYFREPLPEHLLDDGGELDVETDDAWHCGGMDIPAGEQTCYQVINGVTCSGKTQCVQGVYHPVWCSSENANSWGVCNCIPNPGGLTYGPCVLDDPNCGQEGE
jgi:hypothetical protein